MDFEFKTLPEVAQQLGSRIRDYRIRKGLDQKEVARLGGLTVRTLRDLEQGNGSSLLTLLRVMRALDALDGLDHLFPMGASVDPIALLDLKGPRQRVGRRRQRG